METYPKPFDLDAWVTRWNVREAHRIEVAVGSANAHYRVIRRDGEEWFLKVYDQQRHHHREVTSYHLLVNDLGAVPAPPLRADGESDGRSWAAFAWRSNLCQIAGDSLDDVGLLAEMIAAIHDCPVPPDVDLPEMPRLWPDLVKRVVRVRDTSASFADTVEAVVEPVASECERYLDEVEPAQPRVLLHGDVAFRNLFSSSGTVYLADFERAAVGMADFDFGKLWDQDLGNHSRRQHFANTYRQARNRSPARWPDDKLRWAVRLWAALGVVPYAERVGDWRFRAFADEMIAKLRAETLSVWSTGRS